MKEKGKKKGHVYNQRQRQYNIADDIRYVKGG